MENLEQLTTTIDIRIRGEIGYVFSLVENQLLRIILFSKAYKTDLKPVDIKKVTLAVKVDMAYSAIKKFDKQLHESTAMLFDFLKSKSDYRNMMTHGKYEWDINDLSTFEVWDIVTLDDEEKTQYHKKVKLNLIDISDTNTAIMMAYNMLVPISNRFEKYGLTNNWE